MSAPTPKRDPTMDYQPIHHHNITEDHDEASGLLIREIVPAKEGGKESRQLHPQNVLHAWWLEICLLFVALGLLIAIVLILHGYSEQEKPNWGENGITLNALIALLATIYRAIVAFIIFEVIAQVKWGWVSARFQPMNSIQIYDDASRGVYSAMRLLPVVAFRQPLALAAILAAVLSIAIGPMTQQTVQSYSCRRMIPDPAKIITANGVNGTIADRMTSRSYQLNLRVRSAMQDAIVNPTNDSNIGAVFDCPSGTCTFPTYSDDEEGPDDTPITHATLGICSRCEDVYDAVQGPFAVNTSEYKFREYRLMVDSKNFNTTPVAIELGRLFNRKYMSMYTPGSLAWASKVVPTDFMNQARWSLANISILAVSQDRCSRLPSGNISCPHYNEPSNINGVSVLPAEAWDEPTDYVAAACTVSPCLKYYSASVDNGVLSEKLVRSTPLRQQYRQELWAAGIFGHRGDANTIWKGVQIPCSVNGTLYTWSNMSSSAVLGPNVTVDVVTHQKGWEKNDINSPLGYRNVTAPLECVSTVAQDITELIGVQISRSFQTNCTLGYEQQLVPSCSGNNDSSLSNHMSAIFQHQSTSLDSIRNNIDSMTMRLTNEIRLRYSPIIRGEAFQGTVQGQIWENRQCVRVDWAWLALPASVLLLCIVLLAWVIIQGAMGGNKLMWKSSVLPFMLRGEPRVEDMSLRDFKEIAKGYEVKVQKAVPTS